MSEDAQALEPINREQAGQLVAQVQLAHRLNAGFYQRQLQLIEQLAATCGASFHSWGPKFTRHAIPINKNPAKYWAWDLMPLFASWHLFTKVKDDGGAQEGDLHLVVRIYLEESFALQSSDGNHRKQPDPLNMAQGASRVEIELHACKKAAPHSSIKALVVSSQQAKSPLTPNTGWMQVNPHLDSWSLSISLEDLICDFDAIQKQLGAAIEQFKIAASS